MLVGHQHDHFRNRSQIAGLFGACMSPQNRVDVAAGPLCRPKSDSAPSELCCSLQRSTTLSYPHPCYILLDALDENMASYCRDNLLSNVCRRPLYSCLLTIARSAWHSARCEAGEYHCRELRIPLWDDYSVFRCVSRCFVSLPRVLSLSFRVFAAEDFPFFLARYN